MLCRRGLIGTLLALVMCCAPGFAGAHDHEHSHDAGATGKLELRQGAKWPTDANLRQGMEGIRHAMREKTADGLTSEEQAKNLSQKVNEQVTFMVQNCKLDRDTDAMLHLVLADIIAGAEQLSAGQASEGADRIFHALENYGSYFDHPGWH